MPAIVIEQAIYSNRGAGGYQFPARSPGFRDDWLTEAERLCAGFGDRPTGVVCPGCVFVQPFGKGQVAVVQAADQGADDTGRPGALGFHLLVLTRAAYRDLGGDPFLIADRFPPAWQAREELPDLTWDAAPPVRTIEQVREVLQTDDGPTLLGAAQALVDGCRLVFERPAPDSTLLRRLWMLLPISTRCALWPASFAFGHGLSFHVLVVPRAGGEELAGYLEEQLVGDYPEGPYESSLQMTAQGGDQAALNALFARRSPSETWRLGLTLLAVLALLMLFMNWLRVTEPPPPPRPEPPPAPRLELPPADDYPRLEADERRRLTAELRALAERLGETLPPLATAEEVLTAIDRRLGTPDLKRDPGPLAALGPVQRQLQALLWKHAVADYQNPRLNPCELVERLDNKVRAAEGQGKDQRD